jgi:hypothetical protein
MERENGTETETETETNYDENNIRKNIPRKTEKLKWIVL